MFPKHASGFTYDETSLLCTPVVWEMIVMVGPNESPLWAMLGALPDDCPTSMKERAQALWYNCRDKYEYGVLYIYCTSDNEWMCGWNALSSGEAYIIGIST